MTIRPTHPCLRRRTIAVGVCLALTGGAPADAAPANAAGIREPASPFLELEAEIPLGDAGVGLDIAVGSAGDLYLSDEARGGIRRLSPDAVAWQPLVTAGGSTKIPRHPTAIAADQSGRLWIADAGRRRVVVMDAAGEVLQTYEDGRRSMRKPTRLARATDGRMAAWDAETSTLVQLGNEADPIAPVIAPLSTHPGTGFCIPAAPQNVYCVGADRKTLTRQVNGKPVTSWTAPGTYPRIGGFVVVPRGDVYLADTAGRRLYLLDAELSVPIRLRLYESLLQSPTRLAVSGTHLWLLDEGRKSVLRFQTRTAETAWEHAILGEEYLALGQHDPALQELTRARRLGLDHPELNFNQGIANYGLGRFAQALAAWDALPPADQGQSKHQFWRANALFRLGRHRDAATLYAAIAPSAPESLAARFNLAQAQLGLGDNAAAQATLEVLLNNQPDNHQAQLALARALIGLGRDQDADALLDVIAKGGGGSDPLAGEAAYLLGHRRLSAGVAKAALPLLEQAARLGPSYRAALTDLAVAHRELGDLERARLYEQRAAGLDSDAAYLANLILEDAP